MSVWTSTFSVHSQSSSILSVWTSTFSVHSQSSGILSVWTSTFSVHSQSSGIHSVCTSVFSAHTSVTASHQAFTQCAHPLSLFTTSHQGFTEYGHPFSLFTASHQVEAQSPPWDHLPFCQKPKTGERQRSFHVNKFGHREQPATFTHRFIRVPVWWLHRSSANQLFLVSCVFGEIEYSWWI